jgi:hypothetical protein
MVIGALGMVVLGMIVLGMVVLGVVGVPETLVHSIYDVTKIFVDFCCSEFMLPLDNPNHKFIILFC